MNRSFVLALGVIIGLAISSKISLNDYNVFNFREQIEHLHEKEDLKNAYDEIFVKEEIGHYFSGYKQKEVSNLIKKSNKATESLIIRARKKLKTILPNNILEELLYV